jgi:hypothetical protein
MPFPFKKKCCCCTWYSYNFDGILPGDVVGNGVPSLADARLCFAGPLNNSCASEYAYDAGFQAELLAWVEAGGRLFLTADNVTCFDLVYPNRTSFNNLLGYLGSSMQLTTNFPFGCPETSDCAEASPGFIGFPPEYLAIVSDLPAPISYKQGGEISGGFPLAYTSTVYPFNGCDVSHVLMAGEQIGEGMVIACASSYLTLDCDGPGLYEFLRRLCKWPVADILAV